jgi:hypothetical protein
MHHTTHNIHHIYTAYTLTNDERRDHELDEAHLHVAETNGVSVAHGAHLQAQRLLLVALQAELL